MTGPMFDVVHFDAISERGRSRGAGELTCWAQPPPPVKPIVPAMVSANISESGRQSYFALCAGCHGLDGQGLPHVSVPLRTNSSLGCQAREDF